jgi:phosphoglycerate kinase
MRKIQDADVAGKKVLVRADFNVELANGDVKEKFKLEAIKETVDFLLAGGAKVAIVSHMGRPDGKTEPKFSLFQIKDDIEKITKLKIKFVDSCVGWEVETAMENLLADEVLLLENVRFYEGEEQNDENFSKQLAENFDIFVNDAFSVCHRNQASVTGVAKILPSYAGFRLQKELENLEKVKNNPASPSVAIIGGAKIETKLPLIKKFEETYDHILIGGKIANEAMDQGLTFSGKVIMPLDFAQDRLDIGPETIKKYKEIILGAKTIIWNGPMGKFETAPYDIGTKEVLTAVIESGAFSLMGGGESVQLLEEQKAMSKISFVSTGGGAMLEFLTGEPLSGLKALGY